jgi:hypothetical protein
MEISASTKNNKELSKNWTIPQSEIPTISEDNAIIEFRKLIGIVADFNKVNIKDYKYGWQRKEGWSLQDKIIKKHLNEELILGINPKFDTVHTVVVDIDAHTQEDRETVLDRYYEIVDELNYPSFVIDSSNSGGLHLYYIFKKNYHARDLKASFKDAIGDINNVDILCTKEQNIRVPLGEGSNILNPHCLTDRTITNNIQEKLYALKQYHIIHDNIEYSCPLIKVSKKYKKLDVIQTQEIDESTLGFSSGNRLNTLINLFNQSKNEEHFLSLCDKYSKLMKFEKRPSRDLCNLTENDRILHFKQFYIDFSKTRLENKKTSFKPSITVLSMLDEDKKRLSRFFRNLDVYHLMSTADKKSFLEFAMIICNNFYNQMQNNRTEYALPSTYMRKINYQYKKYFTILLNNKLSDLIKNYSNNTTNYHSRIFNVSSFESFFNTNARGIKLKTNILIPINNNMIEHLDEFDSEALNNANKYMMDLINENKKYIPLYNTLNHLSINKLYQLVDLINSLSSNTHCSIYSNIPNIMLIHYTILTIKIKENLNKINKDKSMSINLPIGKDGHRMLFEKDDWLPKRRNRNSTIHKVPDPVLKVKKKVKKKNFTYCRYKSSGEFRINKPTAFIIP